MFPLHSPGGVIYELSYGAHSNAIKHAKPRVLHDCAAAGHPISHSLSLSCQQQLISCTNRPGNIGITNMPDCARYWLQLRWTYK